MVLMGLHALFVWIAVSDLSTPGIFVSTACLVDGQRAGLGPPCRPTFCGQKVGKEPAPATHVPALRYGQPAPSSSWSCAAKLTSSFARRSNTLPQVRARSCCTLRCNCQPQELAVAGVCKRGDTECGQPDSFFLKLIATSVIRYWDRCQFRHKSHRPSVPIPFGCACGMRFRLRETLPQDSVASFSSLPPFV